MDNVDSYFVGANGSFQIELTRILARDSTDRMSIIVNNSSCIKHTI